MYDEPQQPPRGMPPDDRRSRSGSPASLWILSLVLLLLAAYYFLPLIIQRASYAIAKGQNRAWREELGQAIPGATDHNRFTQIARVAEPAVVEVRTLTRARGREVPHPTDPFLGDGEALPPGYRRSPREFVQRGLGSGFVLDADKGYVVTNSHVVAEADQVQVILADGRIVRTQWVRTDPQTDLAVLKIDAQDLIGIPLGDSQELEVGDWVLAIGAPGGLDKTVTAGIISAKGRTTGDAESYQDFLQTDAAINPGNSGGPLINMRAEVVGINTAIISPTGVNAGIGLAIPSNMAKQVIEQLVERGEVIRGYIGVSIQAVSPQLARSFNLPTTQGALVANVVPGGPAEQAGLRPGDFIVSVADRRVQNANELRNVVAAISPGQTAAVEFYRNGQKQTADVTVAHTPDRAPAAQEDLPQDAVSQLGLQVASLTPQVARQYGYRRLLQGVIITRVAAGSPADLAGLAEGMVITHAGSAATSTVEQLEQVIAQKAGQGLRLRVVEPSGRSAFVFVAPQP